MNDAIISVANLEFAFKRKKVFQGLNVTFAQGESVVIAGRNGAGKSTLLRCLAGVYLPDRGEVRLAAGLERRRIGYISDSLSLFEDWPLERAIAFHVRTFGAAAFDDRLLKNLGLSGRERIRQLSAGERVIFHLSLILSQQPELLLIDEILHLIDPYIRELFIDALIESMASRPVTVLMVNHTFNDIERIPERIMIMDGGGFILDESAETLPQKVKKIVFRGDVPAGLPCLFVRESGHIRECFVYPFGKGLSRRFSGQFQDIGLAEIIKAFIGGAYAQKRVD